MKITVSCVQLLPRLGDKQYNLEKMRSWVETVMTQYPKTQLIVFPELMTSGYEGTPEMFQELAETLPDGESMRLMGELARKHHVHIVYGFPERDPVLTDVLYNAQGAFHGTASVLAPVTVCGDTADCTSKSVGLAFLHQDND